MEYPIVVKLPRLFYIDHRDRDLPSGNLLRTIGNRVEVELDKEAFDDLISDAEHYGFGGMDWDGVDSEGSLERSAKRVYEILTKIEEEGND
jgi:hypothetical protein